MTTKDDDFTKLKDTKISVEEDESDLSFCTAVKEISRFALWPILGLSFHPMYSVINAAVVGRMESKYLAALGLGSLTTGILLISISTSFSLVIGSFVSPAHGRGETELARMYLHR